MPAKNLEPGNFVENTNSFTLQPVDRGFGAWSYAASTFAMFIVVWGKQEQSLSTAHSESRHSLIRSTGFPQSCRIFQRHLSLGASAPYADSAILPLLAPGMQDKEEGILFQFLPKAARHRQMLNIFGIFIMLAALILASVATAAWQIVATQGILYGAGGILLNFVHVSNFSEWFEKR